MGNGLMWFYFVYFGGEWFRMYNYQICSDFKNDFFIFFNQEFGKFVFEDVACFLEFMKIRMI